MKNTVFIGKETFIYKLVVGIQKVSFFVKNIFWVKNDVGGWNQKVNLKIHELYTQLFNTFSTHFLCTYASLLNSGRNVCLL